MANPYPVSYNVLALRAQIRAAFSMLTAIDGYGNRNESGETLCDLGFMLKDADEKLGEIYGMADNLETQLDRVQNAAESPQAVSA